MIDREKEYSAAIISESSWFIEFKQLVFLYHSGLSSEEIQTKCIKENLFGMFSEKRAKGIYGYLNRRMSKMNDFLISLFCESNLATQKIINLITIIQSDKLFFEFVNEVYREKILLGYDTIELQDTNSFFRSKSIESESITNWTPKTCSNVKNCYLNFMNDANLVRREKQKYIITPPILDISLEHYLQDHGDEYILKAITGVK